MSDPSTINYAPTGASAREIEIVITSEAYDWEQSLLKKIRQLRSEKKRLILLLDGDSIFMFRAEPEGVIRT